MENRQLEKIMLVLIVLGIIDSSYLTISHYTNTVVACPDSGIINCANVLNSPYSVLLGVPLTLWGLIFFIIDAILLLKYKQKDALIIYNGVGVGFVVYLLFVEYTVRSICIYCTAVHIIVVLLFILSIKRS